MLITRIEKQAKNPRRYSVYIDGNFAFGIDGDGLLEFRLSEGVELDETAINEIEDSCLFKKARDKALRLLGVRARSEKELLYRLSEGGFPSCTIEKIIEFLKSFGYIDDYAFAREYFDELMKKGVSIAAARYKLCQKGVSREITDALCKEANGPQSGACLAALRKKYRGTDSFCEKELARAYSFLRRKGFKSCDIKEALKRFGSTGKIEDDGDDPEYF